MTSNLTCPSCGAAANGNFCASCGSSLGGRFCTQCGSKASPGAAFCTDCGAGLSADSGAPTAAASGTTGASRASSPPPRPDRAPAKRRGAGSSEATAGAGSSNTAWWVGGAMMVVVILFMAGPLLLQEDPAPQPNAPFAGGGAAGAAGGAGAVDLSSMTPRQAADRLFERVMIASEAGNSAEVTMFLPMSIQAYEMLEVMDPDAHYHLSRLQLTGTFNQEALDAAQAGLELYPNHLLNLYAAGDAALALGDTALAQRYFSQLLEAWDSEMASGNVDYQAHARQMDSIRQYAEENVGA